MICVECEAPSVGLFPYAMELSGYVATTEQVREDGAGDHADLVRSALEAEGLGHWSEGLFLVAIILGGRYKGISAVGFGTNKKARQRAARLALVATCRARLPLRNHGAEDPSGDGLFPAFVDRARLLLGLGLDGAPGAAGAGEWFEAFDHHGAAAAATAPARYAGAVAAAAAATSAAAAPPAMPYGLPSAARQGNPAAAVAVPSAQNQEYASVYQAARPDREDAQSLYNRMVRVQAAYSPEASGYLRLWPGDMLQLKVRKASPPGDYDRYRTYVFGERLGNGYKEEGWFPYDLVCVLDL